MPTLTNSTTFSIGAGSPEIEQITIDVLPPIGVSTGRGRLVHPTLGTLDYAYRPNKWSNIDGDVIAPPVWATTKTLRGASNTLWRGDIRDVEVFERWDDESGDLRMPIDMLRMLILFWTNPPDPSVAAVVWSPNYTTDLSYLVAIKDLQVGGEGVTLDMIASRGRGWARGDVTLRMQILGRVV